MDAKSVITSPSPQMPITHGTGPLVISGLAWSGHGQITRVDVSKDGGITWETARLGKQGDTKALTRFYLDTDGTGDPMLLQSRAMDETGYVQPTKDQLARSPRRKRRLPQQLHPDLVCERRRDRRECRSLLIYLFLRQAGQSCSWFGLTASRPATMVRQLLSTLETRVEQVEANAAVAKR